MSRSSEVLPQNIQPDQASSIATSRFVRACLRQPVDRTPVWFLRQAGRYMPEYMAVRKHHSLLDICRTPDIAAEVTITAAERLGVDAAIIFADLLLPFTPMGLDFEFVAGEGPVVHTPVRTAEHIRALRTDRVDDLSYVSRAIEKVAAHFSAPRPAIGPEKSSHGSENQDQLGIIGFCGAPFTLASYMIEGGSSRNYIETKRLMYADPASWSLLMEKARHRPRRVRRPAGRGRRRRHPDLRQLGRRPLRHRLHRVLPRTPPPISSTASRPSVSRSSTSASILLPFSPPCARPALTSSASTGASPSTPAGNSVGPGCAVQGNLDPITLFAPPEILKARVEEILSLAANRPGHIFNLGHGIVPGTPVENVIEVVRTVRDWKPREVSR